MPPLRSRTQTICWNNIRLRTPGSWNGIVKGPNHLIFETGPSPLLEFRWHRPGTSLPVSAASEDILAQLLCSPQSLLKPEHLPASLDFLRPGYEIHACAPDRGIPGEALLCCTVCSTVILVKFYPAARALLQSEEPLLEEFSCHTMPGKQHPWRFEDICFLLPDGFNLVTCSFTLGVITLSFAAKRASLRLVRLSSAGELLKRSSPQDLFRSIWPEARRIERRNGDTLVWRETPPLPSQLFARMRRRHPFHYAWLRHYPERNKLLGLHWSGTLPGEQDVLQRLEDTYGFVEEDETDRAPDPGGGAGLHPDPQ